MKNLILIHIFIIYIFANDTSKLNQARIYEKNHEYEKAMKLYKEIALKKQSYDKINIQANTQTNLQTQIQSKKNKKLEEKIVLTSQEKKINFFNSHINDYEDKQTGENVKQMIMSSFNIYPYKSNYFLPVNYDSKQREERKQYESKFQLSIRKPISYNIFGLNEEINFAYTQTSWWQTFAPSAPFRETNYQPELFVTFPSTFDYEPLKAYKVGFIHESNGRGGDDSRSWNRIYLESYLKFGNLFVIPKVWYRIPEKEKIDANDTNGDNNPDIRKYLGYGDLSFIYPYKNQTFKAKFRNNLGTNGNKGSAQLDWTFPLTSDKSEQSLFGYIQLFNGYGESLIDYDKHMNKISIGIAISR